MHYYTNLCLFEGGGGFLSGRIFFLCIINGQIKIIQKYLTTGYIYKYNIYINKKVKLSKKGNKTI